MDRLKQLFEANRDKPRRFEVVGKAAEEATVYVYDAVGGPFGIDAGKFAKEIGAITAGVTHLRINSPGGDVNAARSMQTAIRGSKSKIIAHVDGLAASAATLLLLSAAEVEASDGAMLMVHNPWSLSLGDAATHRESADVLDKYAAAMVADYMARTGQTEETVRGWLDAETWFSAAEAQAVGLVDRVTDLVGPQNSIDWNLSCFSAPTHGAVAAAIMPEIDTPADEGTVGTVPEEPIMETQIQGQPAPIPDHAALERARCAEVIRIGAEARLSSEVISAAITGGTTAEAFRDTAYAELVKRAAPVEIRTATVVRDERETRRNVAIDAVTARLQGQVVADAQNPFRGMKALRLAEELAVANGGSVRGLMPDQIAIRAMQQTSDFPYILENSARKAMLRQYELAAPTYKIWAKGSTTSDFKTMSRYRLGEAPAFLKVPEGGQITVATMTESREQYALNTYGRGVSFTRQMLINDDLNAFGGVVGAIGMQAAIIENSTVYAILTANANLNDSTALFADTRGNHGAGVIGNTGLDAMFTAMATVKGLDGASILNIQPKYLIVPAAKRATAESSMTATGPNLAASSQNWFAGRLTVVADGVLDASSTSVWYGAADPNIYPGVEYCHLEGAVGPQMVREENESAILGVNLYSYLDFNAKAVDWRPLYYSTGA